MLSASRFQEHLCEAGYYGDAPAMGERIGIFILRSLRRRLRQVHHPAEHLANWLELRH